MPAVQERPDELVEILKPEFVSNTAAGIGAWLDRIVVDVIAGEVVVDIVNGTVVWA